VEHSDATCRNFRNLSPGSLPSLTWKQKTHDKCLPARCWLMGTWTRELTSTDYARIADLVNSYEQLPLGVTDVSDAAIAEPLGLTGGRH
jgi:hypothetical protein